MSEPRAHPRYAHAAAVTLRVRGDVLHGRTTNVSRGGLCADLADPVAVGTELEVDLQLVFDDDTQSDALRLPARVAWCTSVDEAHQVGLAFKPVDADRAKLLTLFLTYLDAGGGAVVKRPKTVDERFG